MTVKEKLKILLKKEIYKYVNIFDEHILTKNNKKIGRKKLYTNNQCLDILMNIIFEGSTFRNTCKTLKNNHAYTSVFKRINLWIIGNVFRDMYINLSVNYKTKNEIEIHLKNIYEQNCS